MKKIQKFSNYEIEDLGIQEIDVYDIEVKDNHNFFANDILVHNSAYFSLSSLGNNLMKKYDGDKNKVVTKIDEFSAIIEKRLKEQCLDLAEYLNSYKQAMHWNREVIAETAILVAKKKYVMKVLDDEGNRVVDNPKYKIMGMESVKSSSTPSWARALLVDCYKIALEGEESDIHKMVAKFEKEFYTYKIEDIAIPTGVNNILKYADKDKIFGKGSPRQVKAALIHNWVIEKYGLKVAPIVKDGSRIRMVALRKPNPINQAVIGFEGTMPTEFGLDKYVDKRELFEKGFLAPLNLFLAVTDWTHEEINTLI